MRSKSRSREGQNLRSLGGGAHAVRRVRAGKPGVSQPCLVDVAVKYRRCRGMAGSCQKAYECWQGDTTDHEGSYFAPAIRYRHTPADGRTPVGPMLAGAACSHICTRPGRSGLQRENGKERRTNPTGSFNEPESRLQDWQRHLPRPSRFACKHQIHFSVGPKRSQEQDWSVDCPRGGEM